MAEIATDSLSFADTQVIEQNDQPHTAQEAPMNDIIEGNTYRVIKAPGRSSHCFELNALVVAEPGGESFHAFEDKDTFWYVYPDEVELVEKVKPVGFKVGDRVVVTEHPKAGVPGFAKVGSVHTVLSVKHSFLKVTGIDGTVGAAWFKPLDITSTGAETASVTLNIGSSRPMIDFTTDSRATARDYARQLDSKVLSETTRLVLRTVAKGDAVDAYSLNAAVTETMSSCATRASKSSERGQLTRMCRHLGHIAQAVLESHADGLPAYQPGDRSRKVESLQEIVDSHQRHIVTLDGEVAALCDAGDLAVKEIALLLDQVASVTVKAETEEQRADAYSEAGDLLAVEVEQLKLDALEAQAAYVVAQAEIDRLLEDVAELSKTSKAAKSNRDELEQVVTYAFDQFTELQRERVFGFWDAVTQA